MLPPIESRLTQASRRPLNRHGAQAGSSGLESRPESSARVGGLVFTPPQRCSSPPANLHGLLCASTSLPGRRMPPSRPPTSCATCPPCMPPTGGSCSKLKPAPKLSMPKCYRPYRSPSKTTTCNRLLQRQKPILPSHGAIQSRKAVYTRGVRPRPLMPLKLLMLQLMPRHAAA